MTEHKNLASAVCAVMKDVRHVTKTGRNDHHKYNYASDADLLIALQPAMAVHGLILLPADVAWSNSGDRVDLIMTYELCHTSGESRRVQAAGSGIDKQDKAAYKAQTGCLKYALRQAFLIPTGDDAEAHIGNHAPRRPNPPATPLIDAGWPVNHLQLRQAIGSAMAAGRWAKPEIAAALVRFGAARVTDLQKPGPVADLKSIIDTTEGPAGLKALGAEIQPTTKEES